MMKLIGRTRIILRIVFLRYNCMEFIKHSQLEKYHQAETQEERDSIETNPYKVLYTALENARPILGLINVRKGAIIYRVPVPGTVELPRVTNKWIRVTGPFKSV